MVCKTRVRTFSLKISIFTLGLELCVSKIQSRKKTKFPFFIHFSPKGNSQYVCMTHGGTQVYVRASGHGHDTLPPPSVQLGRKKNFFFCIGGINSRHLDAAPSLDFQGSNIFKNRFRPPSSGYEDIFRQKNRSISFVVQN